MKGEGCAVFCGILGKSPDDVLRLGCCGLQRAPDDD